MLALWIILFRYILANQVSMALYIRFFVFGFASALGINAPIYLVVLWNYIVFLLNLGGK
ncbi:hypothetical protein HpCK35_31880 [Helicobacter pylori]